MQLRALAPEGNDEVGPKTRQKPGTPKPEALMSRPTDRALLQLGPVVDADLVSTYSLRV